MSQIEAANDVLVTVLLRKQSDDVYEVTVLSTDDSHEFKARDAVGYITQENPEP